jgi:hypothetical protein
MLERRDYAGPQEYIIALRTVSALQRRITLMFGVMVVLFIATGTSMLFAVPILIMWLLIVPSVIRLLNSLGVGLPLAILAVMGLFVPVVNILVVGAINMRASAVLRRAGLRGGILGVDEHELRALEGRLETEAW